ncbi:hypothetical protein [Nocardioides caldifontis]|uniref:hypothetical protein n=1 Tax=Nocardioides caldifontis TaxID=2588938 RepID=UPI0011DFB46B|nr:hypothetical protein [Nocardioides caldifontis]
MVFAHGIGGTADLPIPLPYALSGAAATLAVSFLVLVLAWRSPRFDATTQGHPLPRHVTAVVESAWFSAALRLLGLSVAVYVGWAALAGPDSLANPTFGVVYVLLWVGLVPASLLFGPFYRAVNPLRTLHWLLSKVTGGSATTGMFQLPAWIGLWPAALGLLAFVWLELVYPEANYLYAVRLWFAVYFVVVIVGAAVFGERWIAAADPFEAYSTLVGHLSPFGRRGDGALVVRAPMRNLDGLRPTRGLLAAVSVLLGSTAFDSFQDSLVWIRFSTDADVAAVALDTVALMLFCLLVGAFFAIATMSAPSDEADRLALPGLFAHSLVPIVVGYVVAHYLSYFVEVGQQTLIYLSDPLVKGADYLGTADVQVNYWLTLHPTFLAASKVVAIVGGHVLGVVAAHDRSLKLLPVRHQLVGQIPLLLVMVGYTVGGLYLLLTV